MKRRLAEDPPEINLIPLLDMVSLLIQLLLINAQFGVYAEITTAMGAPSDQPQAGLQLRVDVTMEGFAISWGEADGRERQTLACASGACSHPGAWDTAGLAALAGEIKANHPDEQQVQLMMAPDVPFEVMASAMDALRGSADPAQAMFPDVVMGSVGGASGGTP